MRRAWILLAGVSLLGGLTGCHCLRHTAGVCDCDPPPVGAALYSHPHGGPPGCTAPGCGGNGGATTGYGCKGAGCVAPAVAITVGPPAPPMMQPVLAAPLPDSPSDKAPVDSPK